MNDAGNDIGEEKRRIMNRDMASGTCLHGRGSRQVMYPKHANRDCPLSFSLRRPEAENISAYETGGKTYMGINGVRPQPRKPLADGRRCPKCYEAHRLPNSNNAQPTQRNGLAVIHITHRRRKKRKLAKSDWVATLV